MKSAEECRKACIDVQECVGFTFEKTQTNLHNCALKSLWDPASKSKNNGCCESGQVTNDCRKSNKGIFLAVQLNLKYINS